MSVYQDHVSVSRNGTSAGVKSAKKSVGTNTMPTSINATPGLGGKVISVIHGNN